MTRIEEPNSMQPPMFGEKQLQILFDKLTQSVLVVDNKGLIVYVNASVHHMFGYTKHELVGKPIEILLPEECNNKKYLSRFHAQKSDDRLMGSNLDLFAQHKMGNKFPIEISLSNMTIGSRAYVTVIVSDITSRVKAQQGLKDAKRYLDVSGTIIVAVDTNHKVTLINQTGCDILGYEDHEIIGVNWFEEFIPQEQKEEVEDAFEQLVNGKISKSPSGYKNDILTKKGHRRTILWTNTVLKENGTVTGTLSSGMDISDLENVKTNLLNTESKYKTLFDTMSLGVVCQNLRGEIISANPAAKEILGLSSSQMYGRTCFDSTWKSIYPNGSDYPGEKYPAMLALKEHRIIKNSVMGVYHSKKKQYVWINITATPLSTNDSTNPDQVFTIFEDITDRKLAEDRLKDSKINLEEKVNTRTKELEESQLLYKLIARNFPNGVISVLDRDLNYVFVDGMQMYKRGIGTEQLIGHSFLERVEKQKSEEVREKLLNVLTGKDVSFELQTVEKTHLINAVGMVNGGKDIEQILLVSQNITSLKQAEQNIKKALEKEKHLGQLKSSFVSTASHEFRTPLTTILNSILLISKYIGKEGYEEKQHNYIERAKAATLNLTSIINDFLSLDKLETSKLEIDESTFDVEEFIKDKVEAFQASMRKGQRIYHSHRGDSVFNTDKNILRNIMNNLLSNAAKYSQETGSVYVQTEVSGPKLTLTVKDEGIGIPISEQHNIFQRFFRAKNASHIAGTGLGLNIVQRYLQHLGGNITFESTPGQGSTFKVYIVDNRYYKKQKL